MEHCGKLGIGKPSDGGLPGEGWIILRDRRNSFVFFQPPEEGTRFDNRPTNGYWTYVLPSNSLCIDGHTLHN